ncbi:hypothetical protein SH139x_003260 [Planctomycetaceae bacterium SH139]
MSKFIRTLAVIVIVGSVAGTATIAEVQKIRSTAERRQHPGRGFWENNRTQTVQRHMVQRPMVQHRHYVTPTPSARSWSLPSWNVPNWSTPQWFFGGQSRYQSAPHYQPAQPAQSWRWQHSGRAEVHHPGPRY